jgi:hypothetical protein
VEERSPYPGEEIRDVRRISLREEISILQRGSSGEELTEGKIRIPPQRGVREV